MRANNKRHARELGRIMRKKDREEILSSGGFAVAEPAVRMSINASTEAWALYAGQDLLAVFGVVKQEFGDVVWALTSTHVEKHSLSFYRASKKIVAQLRNRYAFMLNMVHCAYPQALRWVERLGFHVGHPEKYGVKNDLFCCVTLATPKVIHV